MDSSFSYRIVAGSSRNAMPCTVMTLSHLVRIIDVLPSEQFFGGSPMDFPKRRSRAGNARGLRNLLWVILALALVILGMKMLNNVRYAQGRADASRISR
jgi:hypothetical protein